MSAPFEHIDARMSTETLNEVVLAEAYKRALERFEHDRIQPEDFADLYSADVISSDLEYVRRIEERTKRDDAALGYVESAKWGVVLEEVFADQIELNDWLGEGVNTRKASRYDDLQNGVDEIIEMAEESSINYLALAVDVTYSEKKFQKKFSKIRSEIDSGELATVKYFANSEGSFRGRLAKVPRVVVGVNRTTLAELAKLWIERDNKALADHPAQFQILDEINVQLESFRKYAERLGRGDIVRIYDRQLALLRKIRTSPAKQELRKKSNTCS